MQSPPPARPEFNTTSTGAEGHLQSKLLSKSEFDGLLHVAATAAAAAE